MKNILITILIVLLCFSCKKSDDGDQDHPPGWQVILADENGWFGEIEMTGDAVYVLKNIMHPGGQSTKTLVYRSSDAGSTWSKLSYDKDLNFNGIRFLNNDIGFMAGYRLIARTMDAGQTWDTTGMGLINFNSFYIHLNGIIFGYGTGIYASIDTGKTWQNRIPTSYDFNTMDFVDDVVGFTANTGGKLFRTADGGNSWDELISFDNTQFYCIDFYDASRGIAIIGEQNAPSQYPDMKFITTLDGGKNWSEIDVAGMDITLDPASCCILRTEYEIYLGAVNGIFYSGDFGNIWVTQYSKGGENIRIRDIKFSNNTGIATTSTGQILKY